MRQYSKIPFLPQTDSRTSLSVPMLCSHLFRTLCKIPGKILWLLRLSPLYIIYIISFVSSFVNRKSILKSTDGFTFLYSECQYPPLYSSESSIEKCFACCYTNYCCRRVDFPQAVSFFRLGSSRTVHGISSEKAYNFYRIHYFLLYPQWGNQYW